MCRCPVILVYDPNPIVHRLLGRNSISAIAPNAFSTLTALRQLSAQFWSFPSRDLLTLQWLVISAATSSRHSRLVYFPRRQTFCSCLIIGVNAHSLTYVLHLWYLMRNLQLNSLLDSNHLADLQQAHFGNSSSLTFLSVYLHWICLRSNFIFHPQLDFEQRARRTPLD